jgi:hypothetical protein
MAGEQAPVTDNLDSLTRSYKRLSLDVRGRYEFALDSNSDAAFAAAEREQEHLDQGFFVLAFAALEKEINSLLRARRPDLGNVRRLDFPQRLAAAGEISRTVLGEPPVWAAAAREIGSWYEIRSDVAHGDPPAKSFDVFKVLGRANEIAATREGVTRALQRKDDPAA